ncbi:fructosamine kinase family protein [Microbacterium barkeri]|uniref:fructosamine kinase family protein n=1 Tax=Microbacterium barkeri TaxID=33917 RepID=UPI0024AEE274|nr:fructosamine kinase family protein [Microbacterium barkeri]MDI6944174.1 fructosamine kinase family protein [Microbacterium barkeri]
MGDTFTKTRRDGDDLLGEAAGLRWLAEADGGARVARVVSADRDRLVLERIDEAAPSAEAARAFGRALARTHAAGAAWWGCPPPEHSGARSMGRSRTPLVVDAAEAADTWGAFYAEHRVEVFARRLRDDGVIDEDDAAVFHRLASRLRDGALDHPQPALVRAAGRPVARVHGDMWAGNVLYVDDPSGAALIDPMAHGGHAETDLATLSVFGFPHLEDVYAGYDDASPLADGWRERIGLHQLGIVIMHAHLFRGGYTSSALRLASAYV